MSLSNLETSVMKPYYYNYCVEHNKPVMSVTLPIIRKIGHKMA